MTWILAPNLKKVHMEHKGMMKKRNPRFPKIMYSFCTNLPECMNNRLTSDWVSSVGLEWGEFVEAGTIGTQKSHTIWLFEKSRQKLNCAKSPIYWHLTWSMTGQFNSAKKH